MQQNKLLVFGPYIDRNTGEWRIRHNIEIRDLYQKSNIVDDLRKRRLFYADHARRKERALYTRYYVTLQKA